MFKPLIALASSIFFVASVSGASAANTAEQERSNYSAASAIIFSSELQNFADAAQADFEEGIDTIATQIAFDFTQHSGVTRTASSPSYLSEIQREIDIAMIKSASQAEAKLADLSSLFQVIADEAEFVYRENGAQTDVAQEDFAGKSGSSS